MASSMMIRILVILVVLGCGVGLTQAQDDVSAKPVSESREVRIGVLAFRGIQQAHTMWTPTARYLSSSVKQARFTIVPLTLDTIGKAVDQGEVDFVLTNSASYAELESNYGITRIATLRNRRAGGTYTRFGALILTRSDRDDINSLRDLKGKRFMAVHRNAFGGWWMAWREFLNAGIDPYDDLKQIVFAGFPQDKIIKAVERGMVDAGTVRTDVLERMSKAGKIDINGFKVLNAQQTEGFPFAHSTMLYPEWPFAIVKHTSQALAQEVAIALLNMGSESDAALAANSGGWTVPLDYQPVHDLMKQLKVGPYEHLGKLSFSRVVREYWQWIVATVIFLAFLSGLVFYMRQLNKRLRLSQQESLGQEQRIRALYDVASIAGMSFDEQINEVLKTGCKLLGTEIGRLCKIDEGEQKNIVLNVVAPDNIDIRAGIQLPLDKTFCHVTYAEDRGVAVSHAGNSEWKDSACYEFSHLESYIATPVFVNGEKFGTINYSSPKPRQVPFKETDMDLVRLMSRNVSVILERQHSQEQILYAKIMAEEANSAKSVFLANMSHEIRTPLTSIIGFGESLLDSKQDMAQRIGSIKTIIRSGKHLLQLINDILDLSKVEARKLEMEKSGFSLFQVISEVDSLIRMQARDHGLEFNIHYNFPLPATITSEPLRLKQVLINLCSNAIKFTETGSVDVTVSYNREKNEMEFEVRDTGIGLTSEQIEKIFDPFTQADSTTTRKYGGTGLGLSLSMQLVELLGGKMSVQSNIGQGSRFSFSIDPGACDEEAFLHDKNQIYADKSFRPESEAVEKVSGTVLLAEDNADNQVLISMYLEMMGVDVDIVANGREAVDSALNRQYDLILMDMQMPVMDGIEAVTELRGKGYDGAIAALTANAMKEDRDRCIKAGCNDFVTKPINRAELIRLVAGYMKKDRDTMQDDENKWKAISSSMLQQDPEFLPILKGFVENLGVSVSKVTQYTVENNWEELKSLIHQIKGLGGGYGYPMLTDLAAKIEFQIVNEAYLEVNELVRELEAMYDAIVAGMPAISRSGMKRA